VSAPVRVVVAEGPSTRKGLLRFVLEGEGYQVVGEAATSAELARAVAVHRPDVVVIDDGIGAMAVGMIRETLPSTRVILVWPGAVVPIGGDARVEPSEVLRELGRTMERLTGQPSTTSLGGPLHVLETGSHTRQDPAALREILARGEAARLQRRQRSSDDAAVAGVGGAIIDDRGSAPVVILPVPSSVDANADEDDPLEVGRSEIVVVPDADLATVGVGPIAGGGGPAGGGDSDDPGGGDEPGGRGVTRRHRHKR
jgi:hypothetical protein